MFIGVPGLKVVLPATAADAKGLMATAIRDDNPVCFFHHYLLTLEHGEVPDGEYLVPFGEADDPPDRQGRHDRRDRLDASTARWRRPSGSPADGVDAEVIDPRTLAPLDTATILESVAQDRPARARRPVDAARQSASAVIAAEVADQGFDSLRAPIKQVTALDATIPYSEPMERLRPARRGQDRRRRASRSSAIGAGGRLGVSEPSAAPTVPPRVDAPAALRRCARCGGSARSRSASACSSGPTRSTG